MRSRLICVHSTDKSRSIHSEIHGLSGLKWSTCLRDLVFLTDTEVSGTTASEFEIYRDQEAYRFCLEVVCGLRSSLLGETEVMGQFKNFVKQLPESSAFQSWGQNLLSDAKKIRSMYLKDFGSQSYGRLASDWSRGLSQAHVIGLGHLAQELEPWLKKTLSSVSFYDRESVAHRKDRDLEGVVIVAAPLTSTELRSWLLRNHRCPTILIDFREGSRREEFADLFSKIYVLSDAFEQVESGLQERLKRADMAKVAIKAMADERLTQSFIRPFGWDDLCA